MGGGAWVLTKAAVEGTEGFKLRGAETQERKLELSSNKWKIYWHKNRLIDQHNGTKSLGIDPAIHNYLTYDQGNFSEEEGKEI